MGVVHGGDGKLTVESMSGTGCSEERSVRERGHRRKKAYVESRYMERDDSTVVGRFVVKKNGDE